MRLLVYGTGKVVVSAPPFIGVTRIHAFVLKEKEWIQSTLEKEKLRVITAPSLTRCKARSLKKIRDCVLRLAAIHQIPVTHVQVKAMKSQWGSCTRDGNLTFHYKIAYLSEELMTYVVVHELAHRIHMNHSDAFWQTVSLMLPEYADLRRRLKSFSCA